MDGLEIATTTMGSTDDCQCPVCACLKDEVERTNVSYPLGCVVNVKSLLKDDQAEVLEPDCSLKDHCIGKVQHTNIIRE